VNDAQVKSAREFIVQATIQNAPEGRQDALVQFVLSDADRVQRFLLLLLGDSEASGAGSFPPNIGSHTSQSADGYNQSSALFESLVAALVGSPEKLKQIADVVDRLMANEETAGRLPPEFQSIWQPIYDAWMEENSVSRSDGK
jgi:hypothetical protein